MSKQGTKKGVGYVNGDRSHGSVMVNDGVEKQQKGAFSYGLKNHQIGNCCVQGPLYTPHHFSRSFPFPL